MGEKSKQTAGWAGDKEGKPPLRTPQWQGLQVPPGFSAGVPGAKLPPAPLRVPDWQRQPATEKKTPPPETTGGGVREKSIS